MEFSELKIRIDSENSSQAPKFASSMSALHQRLNIQGVSFSQIIRQLQEHRKNLSEWHFTGNEELGFNGITNIINDFYTGNINVYRRKDLQFLVSEEKKKIEVEKQALRGWLNQLLEQNGVENKSVYFQIWERDLEGAFHNWIKNIRELGVEFEDQKKKFLEKKAQEEKKLDLLERQTVALEHSSLEESTSIKILFLSSSPEDEERIRVDKELRILEEHLESAKLRDKISLTKKVAVKPETISKAMLTTNPDIVHFSGHSNLDGIAIENEEGKSVFFPIDSLDRLFKLFKETTKCVVLNSCYSAEQAKVISNHNLYVIGMNKSIGDDSAISFSTGFYQAIGAGKDYEFAFDMGMVLISQHLNDLNTPTLWKDGVKIK